MILWDERLTTVEADEDSEESGVPRSERKKVIDKIAAGLILQSYLNSPGDKNKYLAGMRISFATECPLLYGTG